MTTGRTLVFVHGKGGPERREKWLTPLNDGLRSRGFEAFSEADDTIIEVAYLDALNGSDTVEKPERTWHRPGEKDGRQNWASFLLRQEALALAIEEARNDPRGASLGLFGDTIVPEAVATLMGPVATYRSSPERRHAAWAAVLADLPESGRVVVVAHSLGAIVMLGLLKRLPPALHVDLLVTIGAPMGVESLRRLNDDLDENMLFPADRVHGWVNVFDPGDVITVGRGASRYFDAALDAPIHTGASHSLTGYMSHPAVAEAIGLAAFGRNSVTPEPTLPDRRVHAQWEPLLLRFAYARSLVTTCDTGKWGFRRRLDTAMKVLAQRNVENAGAQFRALLEAAQWRTGRERDDYLSDLESLPVHPGRTPTETDLLRHATDLVRERFSDQQLVVAAVDYLLAPPLPPFDIDIDDDHAQEALGALLQRIRRSSAQWSGQEFAEQVAEAVAEARDVLAKRGFPWGTVLIATGIGLLALTGVGLAFAAPAGLAGAAAISATLATFGPGGMVGGVATLAALTGTATAVTVAGAVVELQPSDPRYEQVRGAMASQLADLPARQLRTSVAGILAVLSSQRRLGLDSDAARAEELLLRTQALVAHQVTVHEAVAPGSSVTDDWKTRLDIVERALRWISRHAEFVGLEVEGREAVVKAIESGPDSH